MLHPTSFDDVQQAVRQSTHLIPRGGGTKPALSSNDLKSLLPSLGGDVDVPGLDLSGLSGVLEYNPGEYTFTALAGTRVAEVQALLAAHGQYLPFDPPLAGHGATLGGTLASGLSGPGRYRYGGVRDFILGVRFVDGNGQLVHGGGKVVKNAAGFDLPKLMVGSLGQFGVLVELTFKVFPRTGASITIHDRCPTLATAIAALYRLYTSRFEIDALDLAPEADGTCDLWVRLSGLPEALPARAEHLRVLLGGGEVIDDASEPILWQAAGEFAWAPAEWNLVKVPLTPRCIVELEKTLAPFQALRRYSAGGNVAWVATPMSAQVLDPLLLSLGLPGLVLFGPPGQVRIGAHSGKAFEQRIKSVLDPLGKFPLSYPLSPEGRGLG
jgi:glycolate oxidase FAD binding subunit